MSYKKIAFIISFFLPVFGMGQTSYVVPGMQDDWLLNRVEIKFNMRQLAFSSIKPYSRKDAVTDLEHIDSMNNRLSKVDRYNIESFLAANSEWSSPRNSFLSRKPVLKHFYKNKANAYELKGDDYHIIFNPILQYQQYREKRNAENVFLNSRGLQARGVIGNKVGFSFYFTENQERPPSYVNQAVNMYQAVPGIGFFKTFKNNTGYDYFDIKSSLSWKVAKFMDMQLAYDKNFIGNGYRSLLLSDFSANYMFLKVNTHFKNFHYQNIFAELFPYHAITFDRVLPRKYYRATYLDYKVAKWLTIGLFEGTMMGRDKLTIGLFNPVIYLQFPGNKNTIKDRNYLGFDIKANLVRHIQLYGQLLIDKLKTDSLAEKSWTNRFGYQAGLKYIDVFGLKNVDIQLEYNRVRPYTYAAADTMTSYTHYNQPLAHPLGANFSEMIGIIKAQPFTRVYLQGKVIRYTQGLNSGPINFGNNPFGGFGNRPANSGLVVGNGNTAKCLLASVVASYELKQNLFIEASFTKRNFRTDLNGKNNTMFASLGIRWNMARREFDF